MWARRFSDSDGKESGDACILEADPTAPSALAHWNLMPKLLPFTLVARCLALLLIVTAALKLHGLGADPIARRGVFSAPELQLVAVQIEVLLAFWLWVGKAPVGPWLASLAVFSTFAAASFYLGWVGQGSCGCAGALISVSPWYACGADLCILAALALGRPDVKPAWDDPRTHLIGALKPAFYGLAATALPLGVLLGTVYLTFGSVRAAAAHLRGERVSISPGLADLGAGPLGESHSVAIDVWNWTGAPVRLIGGTADCSCTVLQDLPLEIGAGDVRSVTVNVLMAGKPGIFMRKAGFLIDDHGIKRIDFRLTGRIVDTGSASPAQPVPSGSANGGGEASRTCQLQLRDQPCSVKFACLILITARKGAFR